MTNRPSQPNGEMPPPTDPARFRRWGLWAVLCAVLIWGSVFIVNMLIERRALAAADVIHFSGLALKVQEVSVRPLDDRVAVRATVTFLDRSSDRRISNAGLYNGACRALLSSGLLGVAPEAVFRASFTLEDPERQDAQFVVGVTDGRWAARVVDNFTLYTMPEPLNGWVLRRWEARREILGGDDLILEVVFTPRVDADPELSSFDHDFACRVFFADWPFNMPVDGVLGRPWSHIKVIARTGIDSSLFHVGRSVSETYEFDSPICRGEAA